MIFQKHCFSSFFKKSAPFILSSLFFLPLNASAKDSSASMEAKPENATGQSAAKIQKEAYDYRHQSSTSATVKDIKIDKAVLRKSSDPFNLIEGSFILKNTANKDFLLKKITAEKCKTVKQFHDNQSLVEATEDASGNIFKNLPIPHTNIIAFPFSSFHLGCQPQDKVEFTEGESVPFIFHFQEGDRTFNFTFHKEDSED